MDGLEETYHLTLWGCLQAVCMDYDVDVDHLTPKMGEHFVKDLMETLVQQGYIVNNNSDGEV